MTTGPPPPPEPRLGHDRYCSEIADQTRLLRQTLAGADLAARVPTCPDWSLRELAVHVGAAHRWVHEMVRTRATTAVEEGAVPRSRGPEEDSPQALDTWLAEGADLLADALRASGPEAHVWTWAAPQNTAFWARRMAHETVVHRADAHAAVPGTTYEVSPDLAADCVDEWLDILTDPSNEDDEDLLRLRERPGTSLHLHATDSPAALDGTDAEWLIELTGGGVAWSRAHGRATVAVRGPLTDVLRVFHRRLSPESGGVEVLGDAELLRLWLECTRWG